MTFDWNQEKNEWLNSTRDITFEEIICLIEEGFIRAILKHPNKPGQKIFVVERDGYAYNVPFIETADGHYFLKTIYPSRISTKKFLQGNYEKESTNR